MTGFPASPSACGRLITQLHAPFWHSDIVVFGTYQELVRGLTAWTETQWDNVWRRTDGFAFDLENTAVLASADGTMATAIAPWTSTKFHPDGTRFERPGRATIVLMCQPDGRWLGVHSHMSLQRGVPQDSHGDRPVNAVGVRTRPGTSTDIGDRPLWRKRCYDRRWPIAAVCPATEN
jgi:ketosteroid isomerase-like protein